MRINTNVSAFNAWRHTRNNNDALSTSLERLSSGLRVNRASDDAAGLSISEALRSQVKGSQQALRNAQDGVSAIGIADGALDAIASLLQRGRELAVQAANDTYDAKARQAMQDEAAQLLQELDRISSTATFNGLQLLKSSKYTDADRQTVQDALEGGIMKDSLDTVLNYYGFSLTPVPDLKIFLDDTTGGSVAYVLGSFSAPPYSPSVFELHVNMDYFLPAISGGNQDYIEGVMAHELTHALMFEETNMAAFPTWFVEGSAEFLHGADDRVAGDLAAMGGNTPANRQTLINRLSNSSWGGASADYSAGYLATKYLHEQLVAAGHPTGLEFGVQTVLDDTTNDVDDMVALAGYADVDDFLADFKANGAAWMAANVSLGDADLGGIGGADYGGAARTFASQVVTTGSTADPTPWNEVWMPVADNQVILQTGANEGQELTLALSNVDTASLGLGAISLTGAGAAGLAITDFDRAIQSVSVVRGALGAQANQLEHTMASLAIGAENQAAAESRIRDTDMAETLVAFTRQQILAESSQSMIAQANVKPALLLSLLAG